MIERIYAITINTFREAVRDRVLYGVLGFGTAVLLFTLALAELSLEERERVVIDIGLASISIFSVLVAIFLGSSLLYKEIERKTLYVILPRPIRRWEFLVGKYLGIVLTGTVFITTMGAIQLWVTAIMAGASWLWLLLVPVGLAAVAALGAWRVRDRTALLAPWSLLALAGCAAVCGTTEVDLWLVLTSLLLFVGEVAVLAAAALLFSSFSTPFLTGVFTGGVWLVGRSAGDMASMRSQALPEELRNLLHLLAEVVPNFNLFFPGRNTLTTMAEQGGLWLYVGETMGYAFCYAAILLVVGAVIFRRRDFL